MARWEYCGLLHDDAASERSLTPGSVRDSDRALTPSPRGATFPNVSTADAGRPTWVAWAGAIFKSVDWFVPPYKQGGVLRKLASEIDSAPADQKHAVLEAGLRRLYGPGHLAAMFLGRYRQVDHVRGFDVQIREAIEASAFGLDHAAVATVLTVLEGVVRRLALAEGRDVGLGTKKLIGEVEALAAGERRALANMSASTIQDGQASALQERVDMVDQIRDFLASRLLENTSNYAGIDSLNRHGILHGVFNGYGVDTNFHKLISFLDALVFFISLRTGVSFFAPDPTPEAQAFAAYLLGLANSARARPRFA